MKTRAKRGCLLALAAPFVFAIVLLLVLHAIGRAHSIWPPRLPDVRLEPSRPILTEAQITPDNAYFYIRQMTYAPGGCAEHEESLRFEAMRGAGKPYPALEAVATNRGPQALLWDKAAALRQAQCTTTVPAASAGFWLCQVQIETKRARFRAGQALEQNRWEEAFRIWSEALQVSSHLSRGAPLPGYVMSLYLDGVICADIRATLLESTPPPGLASGLIARLDELDRQAEPFEEVVRQERLCTQSEVNGIFRTSDGLKAWWSDAWLCEPRLYGALRSRTVLRVLGSTPGRTADHLDDLFSHLIREAAQPIGATNDVASMQQRLVRKTTGWGAILDDPVGLTTATSLICGLARVQFRSVARAAALRATEVALALRLHQAEHDGRLPEKLDELVPAWLPAVPRDPFAQTDAPLRYRKDGAEWTVYSVGPNGRDDGGRRDCVRDWYYLLHFDEGDVVFSSADPARARAEYLKKNTQETP